MIIITQSETNARELEELSHVGGFFMKTKLSVVMAIKKCFWDIEPKALI
jgi:hypothetical protein